MNRYTVIGTRLPTGVFLIGPILSLDQVTT